LLVASTRPGWSLTAATSFDVLALFVATVFGTGRPGAAFTVAAARGWGTSTGPFSGCTGTCSFATAGGATPCLPPCISMISR